VTWWRDQGSPELRLTIRVIGRLNTLTRRVNELMSDQDRLEADVAASNAAFDQFKSEVEAAAATAKSNADALQAEVDALKAQPQAAGVDFTSLDALASRLKADAEAAAPVAPATPADPTPTAPVTPVDPTPVTPVVDPANPTPAPVVDPNAPVVAPANPTA
jgi:peptidoglycan hydrolase CwlO-like protein